MMKTSHYILRACDCLLAAASMWLDLVFVDEDADEYESAECRHRPWEDRDGYYAPIFYDWTPRDGTPTPDEIVFVSERVRAEVEAVSTAGYTIDEVRAGYSAGAWHAVRACELACEVASAIVHECVADDLFAEFIQEIKLLESRITPVEGYRSAELLAKIEGEVPPTQAERDAYEYLSQKSHYMWDNYHSIKSVPMDIVSADIYATLINLAVHGDLRSVMRWYSGVLLYQSAHPRPMALVPDEASRGRISAAVADIDCETDLSGSEYDVPARIAGTSQSLAGSFEAQL